MKNYNLLGAKPDDIKQLEYDDLYSEEFTNELYGEDMPGAERLRVRGMAISRASELGIGPEYKEYLAALEAELDDYNDTDKFSKTTNFGIEGWKSLNCGQWIADSAGVRTKGAKKFASRVPIQPVEILENKTSGIEKVKLQFYKNNRTRYKIVERNIIAAKNRIVQLASQGIEVNSESAGQLVQYLSDVINLNPLPFSTAYSQMGWHRGLFIPYDEEAVFDGEESNRFLFNAFKSDGSASVWEDETQKLREDIRIRLAMDASFASVLLDKVGALPFVFHLWGRTGTGKTVALMVAMSIWGNPAPGATVRTLNMTQNALIGQAAFLNSLPVAGDELQTIKEKSDNYDKLIMRCTEGIDRGRMIDGTRAQEVRHWRCTFLFTGEDRCTRPNSGGGVKNRCIEVEINDELFAKGLTGNQVVKIVEENYGHAGKDFVRYLQTLNASQLRDEYNRQTLELAKKAGTEPKQAAAMAMILLADRIAGELFYPSEKPLELSKVCKYMTSSEEIDVAERAYQYIVDDIAKNTARFRSDDDNHGEVWGGFKNGLLFFNSTVLKKELQKEGFEFASVAQTWVNKRYIEKKERGYTVKASVDGIRARYVAIRLPDDSEEDETDYSEVVDI